MRYRIRSHKPIPQGSKYPIGLLEVGQSFFVPARDGEHLDTVLDRVRSAVAVWRETHPAEARGRQFTVQIDIEAKKNGRKRRGVGCWRKA